MPMNDWDCPEDLQVGETIEFLCNLEVLEVHLRHVNASATTIAIGTCNWNNLLYDVHLSRGAQWRRKSATTITLVVPTVATYGVTCTVCNEYCEHAVNVPGFRCYRCRTR